MVFWAPKYEGTTILRDVGNYGPIDTAPYTKRTESSSILLWEPLSYLCYVRPDFKRCKISCIDYKWYFIFMSDKQVSMSKISNLSTYHASTYIQIFQAKYHANGIIYLFFLLHMKKKTSYKNAFCR
jgi:hypothetical protein